jgi:hypothetical protein
MKDFKSKEIEASYRGGCFVICETPYPEGVAFEDKKTAIALARWLLKAVEEEKLQRK